MPHGDILPRRNARMHRTRHVDMNMIRTRWTYGQVVGRAVLGLLSLTALSAGGEAAIAAPSQQSAVSISVAAIDARAHPEVSAALVVRNASGVPIAGLDAGAFAVTEDALSAPVAPSAVVEATDAARPTALVLALDVSGSMEGQPLADLKSAAQGLVDLLGPRDEVALMAFADAVALEGDPLPMDPVREVPFTTDRTALRAAIDGLAAGGNTPLYDAATKAVRLAAERPGGPAAVLLFTDGRDEVAGGPPGSGSTVANEDSPIRAANQERVPIFTIGLGESRDEPWLRRVALETGGAYTAVGASSQLAAEFAGVLARLKHAYRVSWRSVLPADGAPHRATVDVTVASGSTASAYGVWRSGALESASGDGSVQAGGQAGAADPGGAGDDTAADAAGDGDGPAGTGPGQNGAESGSGALDDGPSDTASTGGHDAADDAGPMPLRYVPALALAGLAAVVFALLVATARRRERRRPTATRCVVCGRVLDGPGAPCPVHGIRGTYEG